MRIKDVLEIYDDTLIQVTDEKNKVVYKGIVEYAPEEIQNGRWRKGPNNKTYTINTEKGVLTVKVLDSVVRDSLQLKTYKIKNHDSGKIYRVKAVSYTDAVNRYNKHILKDSWSAYRFKTGPQSDEFKRYLRSRRIYFEPSQDGAYTHFEVKNADEEVDRKANEIAKQIKDTLTEDADLNRFRGARLTHGRYAGWRVKRAWRNMNGKLMFDITDGLNTRVISLTELANAMNLSEKELLKDSFTEDADIAQLDIKSTYLPEDADADNIRYLGFNEKRKLSFYSYGDRYFVHYDLEGRTEEIDKETVQKILKKNILGEIDENDLLNKEPQEEEIVSDAFDWTMKQERSDE